MEQPCGMAGRPSCCGAVREADAASLSGPWVWLVALLAAFIVNRYSPERGPLGTALMLGLTAVYLIVFTPQLWRVGPRPLAFGWW